MVHIFRWKAGAIRTEICKEKVRTLATFKNEILIPGAKIIETKPNIPNRRFKKPCQHIWTTQSLYTLLL